MKTLELLWASRELPASEKPERIVPSRPQPRFRLGSVEMTSPSPDDGPAGREATLAVCGEPRCGCMNTLITFPPTPAYPKCEFWFDLKQKTALLRPDQERDAECSRLAAILQSELTDAHQQQLREWYLAEKLELILTTPLSQIDINNLPDADDGRMVGFVEVFPLGLTWYFNFEGATWAVDDQYCVQPGCQCHETVLSFLKLKDATGQPTSALRDPPALRYDYRSRRTEAVAPGPPGGPCLESLLGAMREAHAMLDSQLEQRHLILQNLYLRRAVQRSQDRFKSLSALAARKVGRNEPCPCGSGRKFKHCCLNKE